ncbi:peroxisomal biogenesis factor 6-like [Dorcoceras hygrometricum]|uniref:Peroxisomal biogenesis factor 6-like n=1 Tax=Dorcoceras hygrometricum TaxID=472368 RepID=A0A2Z7BJN8_9LAMI|nr:peroxisomal biogenesis factor 6-like [Dorcoceras hygrometricum]
MGIDQLKFQSVQLDYLTILQLGTQTPKQSKRRKINTRNRSTRPANQLAVQLNRAFIPTQCINRGNHRSVIIRPVSHHSSVVFRHNQSVGHHSNDSVGPFRHDTVGIRIAPPGEAAEEQKIQVSGDDQYDEQFKSMTFIGCFKRIPCWHLCLAPTGITRTPALHGSTCVTLNGSGIQLAVSPQPLRLRNHNSGLAHRIMVKRLATSPHDPLGITDSACKNQLVVVSVQYGPFNPYIPIRSTTIGKSRVAIDPIAMHTSWRLNSDIASITSIGYPRMSASGESSTTMHRLLHASGSHPIPTPYDPKTNQYNQDLGVIHSTNGNHLESPNEGSSIDHQVTIYLHAQNITMFPTNETWYFASQILVSNSGGLILILTAQSTRNLFRIHSDY